MFADIAPYQNSYYRYNTDSSDNTMLLTLCIVFAILFVVSLGINIALGIFVARTRKATKPQADKHDAPRPTA